MSMILIILLTYEAASVVIIHWPEAENYNTRRNTTRKYMSNHAMTWNNI